VHVLCRNDTRGKKAAEELTAAAAAKEEKAPSKQCGRIQVHKVDCGDPTQLRAFAEEHFIKQGLPCHGLVNNAGALLTERRVGANGLESHVACHVVGLHALTRYMRPALQLAAQQEDEVATTRVHVVNVASAGLYTARLNLEAIQEGFASMTQPDGTFDGALVYAVCKRAQLELTQRWAAELHDDGVSVSCMHPGWVQTDGLDGLFELHPSYREWYSSFREPQDGADTIVWLLAQKDLETGKFWFDREIASEHQWLARTTTDEATKLALWEYAQQQTEK